MKNLNVYLIGILCAFSMLACKKDKAKPDADEPIVVVPLERPKGASMGAAVTKLIGPAGGRIVYGQGRLIINIPAGALAAETAVGIEPITKTNIAGVGQSFRLTPHAQHFEKPVTITYSLFEQTDSVAMKETFGFAYQMDSGVWKFVGASSFDANLNTVSFKTTHFSDWSVMNRVSLSPIQTSLEPGQKQEVKALIYTQSEWEDLLVPLTGSASNPEPGYPVGTPAALPAKFIKSWNLNGPGNIISSNGNKVTYQAPAAVNGSANATVSLNLNAPVSGTFILLSNIEIMADGWAELSVGTGGKFPVTPVVKSGQRYILANPEAEGGGNFLLTWTGGVGSYGFDLSTAGNKFQFLTGNGGYVSSFIHIDDELKPSGGSINITKMDNNWVEGNFTVSNAGILPTLIPTASITGRFRARLHNP